MESYRTLYRIRVEHDYFDGKPCPALQCRLTPQGEDLARRRGLLFRQEAADTWAVLFNETPGVDDVLTLDLYLTDPAFPLYTAWDGFRPSAAYGLELPLKEEVQEAASVLRPVEGKRRIGSGFCALALRMTDEVMDAATNGDPKQTTLHFRAPSLRWEYLFIPRTAEETASGNLRLEDAAGTVAFTAFKEAEAYGRRAFRTVSKSRIPMRRDYGCRLRLTAQEAGRQKRVLLTAVPAPCPGQYADAEAGLLRQVCCY